MPIGVVTIVKMKPGTKENFMRAYDEFYAKVKEEVGCEKYEMAETAPDVYTFTQVYATQDALDKHGKTAHFKRFAHIIGHSIGLLAPAKYTVTHEQ